MSVVLLFEGTENHNVTRNENWFDTPGRAYRKPSQEDNQKACSNMERVAGNFCGALANTWHKINLPYYPYSIAHITPVREDAKGSSSISVCVEQSRVMAFVGMSAGHFIWHRGKELLIKEKLSAWRLAL